MNFLDSDVLIEAQRARPAARAWLNTFTGDLAVPAAVAWELLIGSRDKRELQRAQKFLSTFDVEELDSADSAIARSLIATHCLSSGLSVPDYLIAAQALNRSLFTFNLCHFRSILGLVAQAPYTR